MKVNAILNNQREEINKYAGFVYQNKTMLLIILL